MGLPSGAVVKAPPSHAGGAGPVPGSGAEIPHASLPKIPKQNRSNSVTSSVKTSEMVHIRNRNRKRWYSQPAFLSGGCGKKSSSKLVAVVSRLSSRGLQSAVAVSSAASVGPLSAAGAVCTRLPGSPTFRPQSWRRAFRLRSSDVQIFCHL